MMHKALADDKFHNSTPSKSSDCSGCVKQNSFELLSRHDTCVNGSSGLPHPASAPVPSADTNTPNNSPLPVTDDVRMWTGLDRLNQLRSMGFEGPLAAAALVVSNGQVAVAAEGLRAAQTKARDRAKIVGKRRMWDDIDGLESIGQKSCEEREILAPRQGSQTSRAAAAIRRFLGVNRYRSKATPKPPQTVAREPLEADDACCICQDAEKNAANVPCGHRFCSTCAEASVGSSCAICRQPVLFALKTFG